MWWRVGFKVSRAWYPSASVGVVPRMRFVLRHLDLRPLEGVYNPNVSCAFGRFR